MVTCVASEPEELKMVFREVKVKKVCATFSRPFFMFLTELLKPATVDMALRMVKL